MGQVAPEANGSGRIISALRGWRWREPGSEAAEGEGRCGRRRRRLPPEDSHEKERANERRPFKKGIRQDNHRRLWHGLARGNCREGSGDAPSRGRRSDTTTLGQGGGCGCGRGWGYGTRRRRRGG